MITVRGITALSKTWPACKMPRNVYPEEAGGGGGSDSIDIPGMCGNCVYIWLGSWDDVSAK